MMLIASIWSWSPPVAGGSSAVGCVRRRSVSAGGGLELGAAAPQRCGHRAMPPSRPACTPRSGFPPSSLGTTRVATTFALTTIAVDVGSLVLSPPTQASLRGRRADRVAAAAICIARGSPSPAQCSNAIPRRGAAVMIRAPVTSDRARWQVLWDGYNAFYGRVGATKIVHDFGSTIFRSVRATLADRAIGRPERGGPARLDARRRRRCRRFERDAGGRA